MSIATPANLPVDHLPAPQASLSPSTLAAVELTSLSVAVLLALCACTLTLAALSMQRAASRRRRIAAMRTHDEVTGLESRAALDARFSSPHSASAPTGGALFLIELDHFSLITQAFGREAGDRLVASLAGQLAASSTAESLVGRWSGSQFVVVQPGIADLAAAQRRAEELRDPLSALVRIGMDRIRVTVSVGVALFDSDSGGLSEAVQRSSFALATARRAGPGSVRVDDPSQPRPLSVLEAERHLETALQTGAVSVRYAPVVALDDHSIAGIQATVHLSDPMGRPISRRELLGLIEHSPLEFDVAEMLLGEVISRAARWAEEHPGLDAVMMVEVTPAQIADPRFVAVVRGLLAGNTMDPSHLCLVLSAHLPFDLNTTLTPLRDLKEAGVLIGIDDFGVGWASLAFLRRTTVDVVRVAPELTDVTGDSPGIAITQQIFSLAAGLDLVAIATDVSSGDQAAMLLGLSCELGQGPWFGTPIPADEFAAVLSGGKVRPGRQTRPPVDRSATAS